MIELYPTELRVGVNCQSQANIEGMVAFDYICVPVK